MGVDDRTIKGIKYEDFPPTRKEAREGGFKYYYSGKPCIRNHVVIRTLRGSCYFCLNEDNVKYQHSDKGKTKMKKRLEENPPKSYRDFPPEQKRRKLDANLRYALRNREAINVRKRVENLTPEQKGKKRIWQKRYEDKVLKIPERRMIKVFRSNFKILLKSSDYAKKQGSMYELLGCDGEFLKKHMENQFVKGMRWEDRSVWHVDHIIPLNFFVKHFDFNNVHVQKIAWHYSNLQPLFAKDNQSKRDKIYIQHPESTFEKIVVNMEDDDFEIFVSLLKEEVEKKIQILKDNNTVKGIGKITDSVIKKYYEIVDEPR